MARPYIPPRPGVADPCTCPHCHELTTFTDFDLYRLIQDQRGNLIPRLLQEITLRQVTPQQVTPQQIASQSPYFSAGECARCERIIIFAGDRLIYPSSTPYDARYVNLPAQLQADARQAVLHMESDPAASAARLRGVLAKICDHWGMSTGVNATANATYVSFLCDRLQNNIAMQEILITHCMRDKLCVQPLLVDDERDGKICAIALANLVGDIAEELFGSGDSSEII